MTAFSAGISADAAAAVSDPKPIDTAGTTLKQAVTTRDTSAAQSALSSVRSVFADSSTTSARAAVAGGKVDASMPLRELALRIDSLSGADREEAARYLARPTDEGGDPQGGGTTIEYTVDEAAPACSPDLCVHYVASSKDAPPLADLNDAAGDAGPNGIPDYVDTVLRVMVLVHDTYLDAGYREPRADGTRGGDDRIDIYLAEIGSLGLYGYCAPDQPNSSAEPGTFDRWAYCVLDDDYAGFDDNTQLENIAVTAAHEYFHATQYAYDAFEDLWFLEATAAWAEDIVFDSVNDNLQYLANSPLTQPYTPMDSFIGQTGFHYGTWTYFRFLTEKYDTLQGTMPKLILDFFTMADGAAGGPDQYSYQAISTVLSQHSTTAEKQFLDFSVANRRPRETYEEGKAQKYPTGPLAGRSKLSSKKTSIDKLITIDHLTSATYRIIPKSLKKPKTKLKLTVDMAYKFKGSRAAVTVVPKSGKTKVYEIKLNKKGDGTKRVSFSSKKIKRVEVTLANASARTNCYQDDNSPYSCSGIPKDDGLKQKLSARVLK